MRIGYHTNGMMQHGMLDGIGLLAETGYQSVALNVDYGWLSPLQSSSKLDVPQVRGMLKSHGMHCVVEANANFLLDARRRSFPSLMDHDPGLVESRLRYLKYCIDIAAELEADCMSMQSGFRPDGVPFDVGMQRLVDGMGELLLYAAERDVVVSVEPEPEMLVDTLGRFDRLLHLFDSPRLMLTLDICHIFVNDELPLATHLERWKQKIANVHISDARIGRHEHLRFALGQISFPLVLDALASIDYSGGVHIELPTFSHDASNMIQESYRFLHPLLQQAKAKNLEQ